jgi:hypothetical protein
MVKERIIDLLLLTGISLLCLIIAEILLYSFDLVERRDFKYIYNPNFKYHLKPNQIFKGSLHRTYRINKFGLRDVTTYDKKKENAYRVLILSDSVSFGLGVDQDKIFLNDLQQELTERTGRPFEVINGSCPGYNTHNEYYWYKEAGITFQPDEVLLLFVGNDFEKRPMECHIYPDGSATSHPNSVVPKDIRMILRKSRIFMLFYNLYIMERERFNFERHVKDDHIPTETITTLDKLLAELKRDNVKLRVLDHPLKPEAGSPETDKRKGQLLQYFVSRGVPVTDLSTIYSKSGLSLDDIYKDIVHLSERGHQLLRNVIVRQYIRQE